MRWKIVAVLALLVSLGTPALAHFEDGQIWVVDRNNNAVYKVNPAPGGWTFNKALGWKDGLRQSCAIGFTGHNEMLLANYKTDEILEFDGALVGGVVLTDQDGIDGPGGSNGLVIDAEGEIFIANLDASQILKYEHDYSDFEVFADAKSGLVSPSGMAFLCDGDLIVANHGSGGQLLRFDRMGRGSLFDAISGEEVRSVVITATDDIYVACDSGAIYLYPNGVAWNRTLFTTVGGVEPAMSLDLDQTMILHVNRGDASLRTIDLATGVDTVQISTGTWDPNAIVFVGSHQPPGSAAEYGDGVAGAGGLTPELHVEGEARIGYSLTIEIEDFVGGAQSFFLAGADEAEIPFLGGELLVDVYQGFYIRAMTLPGTPGAPGEGDDELDWQIPLDPVLIGTKWYAQHLAVDPLAVGGMAMSHGLRFYLGE